jgi:predicted MarR family transcription regulator
LTTIRKELKELVRKNKLDKALRFTDVIKCHSCAISKSKREVLIRLEETVQERWLVVSDLCGLINPESLVGAKYVMMILQVGTRITRVDYTKTKQAHQVAAYMELFIKNSRNQKNTTVTTALTENKKENDNIKYRKMLNSKGIKYATTISESPATKGIAKRF